MSTKTKKPLGRPAYGHIPHMPYSRHGRSDYGLTFHQAAILTTRRRDKHDVVFVTEKLDGSCVSVAKINGKITPLIRAGYLATGSHRTQHHYFHSWVMEREALFDKMLQDGQRCIGEWLMEAHGTRYALKHDPFVVFDVMVKQQRMPTMQARTLCIDHGIAVPRLLHYGDPIDIDPVRGLLGYYGHHGALDPVEGAVWRVERHYQDRIEVDFLGKWVNPDPDRIVGRYLTDVTGEPPVYNWTPKDMELKV